MAAKYLIRFDDASEYMHKESWDSLLGLCDRYNIKPLIAVIPFNKDPKMVNNKPDTLFWDKVRLWQTKGYHLALHGYQHVYSSSKSGIIGINKRSEFVGLSIEKQIKMLTNASQKFKQEGIVSKIFIAPAHSFDRNTLKALKLTTDIEYISDGFFTEALFRMGFKWIPSQLWRPKVKKNGIWTICIHPETSNPILYNQIEYFLSKYHNDFIDLNDITEFKNYSFYHFIQSYFKTSVHNLKQLLFKNYTRIKKI